MQFFPDAGLAIQEAQGQATGSVGATSPQIGSSVLTPQPTVTNTPGVPDPRDPALFPQPILPVGEAGAAPHPVIAQYDAAADVLRRFRTKYPQTGGAPPSLVPNPSGGFYDAPNPEWEQWKAAVKFIEDNQKLVDALRAGGGGGGGLSPTETRRRQEEEQRIRERREDLERQDRETAIQNTFALLEGAIARGELGEQEATRRLTAATSAAGITRDLLNQFAGTALPEGTQFFPNAGPGSDLGGLFESITGRPFQGFSTLGTFGIDPNAITSGINAAGATSPLASAGIDPAFQAAQAALVGMGLQPGILSPPGARAITPPRGPAPNPAPRMSPGAINPATQALLGFAGR